MAEDAWGLANAREKTIHGSFRQKCKGHYFDGVNPAGNRHECTFRPMMLAIVSRSPIDFASGNAECVAG